VSRFIFWEELHTGQHLYSDHQIKNQKMLRAVSQKRSISTLLQKSTVLSKNHFVGVNYIDTPSSLEGYKLSLFILVMLLRLCFSQNCCWQKQLQSTIPLFTLNKTLLILSQRPRFWGGGKQDL